MTSTVSASVALALAVSLGAAQQAPKPASGDSLQETLNFCAAAPALIENHKEKLAKTERFLATLTPGKNDAAIAKATEARDKRRALIEMAERRLKKCEGLSRPRPPRPETAFSGTTDPERRAMEARYAGMLKRYREDEAGIIAKARQDVQLIDDSRHLDGEQKAQMRAVVREGILLDLAKARKRREKDFLREAGAPVEGEESAAQRVCRAAHGELDEIAADFLLPDMEKERRRGEVYARMARELKPGENCR